MAESDREYVLGTHDEEIARLGLQHRVRRTHAIEAWQRAGFGAGQHILDVGCGPGFATLDLASVVGRSGRVTAIDRSRRFLDALDAAAGMRQLANITTIERDLDSPVLPDVRIDGAWVRWVFAFVRHPRELLVQIAERMTPGAAIAIHEYFDYASWRTLPPSPELAEFVGAVIESWRASGGEPDIALSIPRWLEELGFEVTQVRPIIEVATAADPKWQWATAFIESGRKRLAALGDLPQPRCDAIGIAAASWPGQNPPVRMMTPGVLEIIAIRRERTA